MNKTYVIHWKSRTNGRIGAGTTRFDRDEADKLVQELNRDYPEIEHQAVDLSGSAEASPLIPAAASLVTVE